MIDPAYALGTLIGYAISLLVAFGVSAVTIRLSVRILHLNRMPWKSSLIISAKLIIIGQLIGLSIAVIQVIAITLLDAHISGKLEFIIKGAIIISWPIIAALLYGKLIHREDGQAIGSGTGIQIFMLQLLLCFAALVIIAAPIMLVYSILH